MGTGIIGLSSASASPLAVALPILSPVKEPGPSATAMASIVERSRFIFLHMSSSIGIKISECVVLYCTENWETSISPSETATAPTSPDVSIESIFI